MAAASTSTEPPLRPQAVETRVSAPTIRPEEIIYGDALGSGSYGKVYLGTCRGKNVAIKKLHQQNLNKKIIEEFKKEVKLCCCLLHPNVLLFMGACVIPGELAIVTEYMPGGDLEAVLKNPQLKLSERLKLRMAKDCVLGMNWLHRSDPPILHRDLKPSNLLVDEHYRVKVCDFGLSCVKHQPKIKDKDSVPGTPLYMAPEVLLGHELDEKCDVYSFGIVLWQILTRREPFPEYTAWHPFKRAITTNNHRPPISVDTREQVRILMTRSWDKNPRSRPSFEELIPMLDKAIVDVTIDDQNGQSLWLKQFGGSEQVNWNQFFPKFSSFMGDQEPNELSVESRCLKELIASAGDKNQVQPDFIVTMEKFGQVVDSFGPLETGKPDFLNRIVSVLQEYWFHGDLESQEAEERLRKQLPGTFMVRVSSQRFKFTISKKDANESINHQRINFHPLKGYSLIYRDSKKEKRLIEGSTEEGLPAFIHKLQAEVDLWLRDPCPGSPFEKIFTRSAPRIDGYLQGEGED